MAVLIEQGQCSALAFILQVLLGSLYITTIFVLICRSIWQLIGHERESIQRFFDVELDCSNFYTLTLRSQKR